MNILLAVDQSQYALAAVRAVVSQFAGQSHNVRLFHVTDWEAHLPIPLRFARGPHAAEAVLDFEDRLTRDARAYLDRLATSLRAAGFAVTIEVQPEGDAKTAILATAAAWPADLVHRAPCPVEIVRSPCAF